MTGERRKWVRKVIMLSTPNCGTAVADTVVTLARVMESGVAGTPAMVAAYGMELTNSARCSAVRDLRTKTVLDYCRTWNDVGGKYWLLGGTYNQSANASYRAAAKLLTGEKDCLVTKMSAWGRADQNMLPLAATGAYSLNHDEMKSNYQVLNKCVDILSNLHASSGAASPAYAPMQSPRPASSGPQTVILDVHSDSISNGQTKDLDVPVDGLSEVSFSLDFLSGNPRFTLVQPDGTVLTPESTGNAVYESSEGHAGYTIETPKMGHWILRTTGTSADSGTSYGLNISGTGTLTLEPTTGRVQLDSGCLVTARVDDMGTGVTGCTVTADCLDSNGVSTLLSLLDDGAHGDEAANDGVYGGQLPSPSAGECSVLLRATGSHFGNDFVRLATTSFTVSPATAQLNGAYSALGLDEGNGPEYEKLRVNVGLNVMSGSSFRVYGVLADSGGSTIATAVCDRTDLVIGNNTVALDFDGDMIRRSGAEGAFTLTGVVVTDTGFDPAMDVLEASDVYTFSGFNGPDFVDLAPPDSITDLAASAVNGGSVTLTWSAPNSEGTPAHAYDVRYSNDGFSYASWDTSTVVTGAPSPAAPGTLQSLTVNGLETNCYYWFCVRSLDENGNISDMSNYVIAVESTEYSSGMPEGSRVNLSGIVTAVLPERIYVERADRSGAVAADIAADDTFNMGDGEQVWGDVVTVDGERKLANTAILPVSTEDVPDPLGMTCASLTHGLAGMARPDVSGLLVRIWGSVSFVGTGFIYIDDGSGAYDGNMHGANNTPVHGVKVILPGEVTVYPAGSYVGATGIVGREISSENIIPVLRMRTGDALTFLSGASISGVVTQAGTHVVAQTTESPHPYPNYYSNTWTIAGPTEASRIRVHFTQIQLESGCDYLRVQNGAGTTQQTYNSNYTDVWSNWVTGNDFARN